MYKNKVKACVTEFQEWDSSRLLVYISNCAGEGLGNSSIAGRDTQETVSWHTGGTFVKGQGVW